MSSTVTKQKAAGTQAERTRQRRQQRKEAGRCVWCGAPRGEDGTDNLCRVHADKKTASYQQQSYKQRVQQQYQQRKEARLCIWCGVLLSPDDGVYCHLHVEKRRKQTAQLERQRKDAGLCIICGQPRGEDGTGTLCCVHAVRRSKARKLSEQKRSHRFCSLHNRATLNLSSCPVCRYYEQPDRIVREINFKGLLPPPISGDELDRCVRCDSCRKVYQVGSSYSFPRLPLNLKLRDERIGDDPTTEIILRFATDANAQGVLAEFKGCSKPERKCIRRLSKITARRLLIWHRRGETQKLPQTCRSHSKDRTLLESIITARLLQDKSVLMQAASGNGQMTGESKPAHRERSDRDKWLLEIINKMAARYRTERRDGDNEVTRARRLNLIRQEDVARDCDLTVTGLRGRLDECRWREMFPAESKRYSALLAFVADRVEQGDTDEKILTALKDRLPVGASRAA